MGLGGGSKQKDLKEDKSSSSVPQTFAHLDLQVRTNKSNVTLHKFKTWENQALVILIWSYSPTVEANQCGTSDEADGSWAAPWCHHLHVHSHCSSKEQNAVTGHWQPSPNT